METIFSHQQRNYDVKTEKFTAKIKMVTIFRRQTLVMT